MANISEFSSHWRALSAASIGLSVGYTFNNYVTNIISPRLIKDLGWTKADFALLGLTVVIAVICQPLAGRITDRLGVKRMALIGVVAMPLLYLLLSAMTGPFWMYYMLYVLQIILVGGTTSAVVYARLISDKFNAARGLALGIAASTPAITGALCAPLLSRIVDQFGWRAGYLAAAGFTAVVGAIAIALVAENHTSRPGDGRAAHIDRPSYPLIAKNRAFQLIIGAIVLCNLTLSVQISQLRVVLISIGVDATAAALMISIYGLGTIAGRIVCGLALDRFAPHLVSAFAMAVPALGLLALSLDSISTVAAGFAVLLLGVSMGAEGDVGAYLVMRYFHSSMFSTVFGLVMGALALSGAIGAILLSALLRETGNYSLFLLTCGLAALAGGLLLVRLGSEEPVQPVGG